MAGNIDLSGWAPNKSTAGKGGITVPFHTERACPALPERYRWAL